MKIKNIKVDGFGVWKGLNVDAVSEDITVLFGRNEAGKTTLMQFVRSMLYGFSPERRSRYVPPIHGGLAGGSLYVDSNHGEVAIQRTVDPSRIHGQNGDLSLKWADGRVVSQSQLSVLTSGIDEPTFNNVFAIGLREIQELAMLDNTDAAEQLYRLTSGLDRVSLVDVMKDLKSQRESIWTAEKGRPSRVSDLLTAQKKLRREIDELVGKSRRWSKIGLQLTDLEDELARLAKQITETEHRSRVVELALQIRDRWNARGLIEEQITAIGQLPDERDVSTAKLDQLNQEIAELRGNMEQNRRHREDIGKQAKALPINRLLWKNGSRIDALQEHGPWIDSLERHISRKNSSLARVKADLTQQNESLSAQFKTKSGEIPEFSKQTIESLRSTARGLKDEKKKLVQAEEDHAHADAEYQRFQEELKTELETRGCDRLIDSLDDSGKLVSRLRRRVELVEQIDDLELKRKDIEHDIDAITRDQVLSPRRLFWLGVVAVTGFVLILGAIMPNSPFAANGPLLAILGVVCLLFAAGLKFTWDQNHRDELDSFQHQLDVIRQQIKRSIHERDELDADLPAGIAHHDMKLKDTETELLRLQDLVPLEARVKTARKGLEESERHLALCRERSDQATKRWQGKLRSLGLPETLSPNHVRDIAARAEKIAAINRKIRDNKDDISQREQELVAISERIRQLAVEVGLKAKKDDPKSQLFELAETLADQRKLVDKRSDFAVEYRKLRQKYAKQERQTDTLLGAKSRMLSKVGAESEDAFREFSMKHEQVKQLWQKHRSLDEQIAAAIGGQITEAQVGEELNGVGGSVVEKRWEQLHAELEQCLDKRSKLHQRRGEYLQEMKTLAEDRRIDEARLELNIVDQQIKEAIRQWQVSATTCLLLESIRESYEAERQPETLKEASTFLADLTGGKYVRIWTKLTDHVLLVDNAKGESLAVEVLSRGTREAVYLALRMALVAAYARRGTSIPMVLDDVLVNFDAQRAHNAATALRDFARRGYQVLMFTCHDHIRDLFLSLDVDVRDLPNHVDVVERGATVKPAKLIVNRPIILDDDLLEEDTEIIVDELDNVIPLDVDDTDLYYDHEPRPTRFVDTHQNELQQLDRELKHELSAISVDGLEDILKIKPLEKQSAKSGGRRPAANLTTSGFGYSADGYPNTDSIKELWDAEGAA